MSEDEILVKEWRQIDLVNANAKWRYDGVHRMIKQTNQFEIQLVDSEFKPLLNGG